MAKLIIKEGERKRIYEICEDTLHIGSTPENNIRLRDPVVSRVHCEIKKTPQGYRIIDLESKRGTKVNGEFINQHTLKHGDRIQIGKALLQFNAGSSAAARFEPRESIRMEQARTRRGMHPAAIIAIGVLVVALAILLIMKFSGVSQYKGLVLMDRVAALSSSTDRDDLEEAKELLLEYEDLPRSQKTPLSEERYEKFREHVFTQLKALDDIEHFKERHQKDYYKSSNEAVLLARKGKYSEAIARLDWFNAKYPDSPYIRVNETKKGKWVKKLEGEVKDIPKTLTIIEEHISNERFNEAKQLIDILTKRSRVKATQDKLTALFKRLMDTAATQWQLQHQEAQEYADEGNYRVPKEIYTAIKKKWGLPKYVNLASQELEKIKLRE